MAGRTRLMLAAACAASLLLSGCQQVRDALAGPTDAELLAAASLTTKDAAADALFQPYPNGDRVVGETSLDLCYGEFPSEGMRVGRRQVAISDPSGEAWVSSEAILYSYPEEAARAMDEIERAREACPDTAVQAPDLARDPLIWEFGDPPDGSWPDQPGVRRQAYDFTVTDPAGDRREATATYLQRGRMILALYASPGIAPASTLRNSPDPARFVQVMSRRLDALPLSSLQEPNPVVPYEDPDDISA